MKNPGGGPGGGRKEVFRWVPRWWETPGKKGGNQTDGVKVLVMFFFHGCFNPDPRGPKGPGGSAKRGDEKGGTRMTEGKVPVFDGLKPTTRTANGQTWAG